MQATASANVQTSSRDILSLVLKVWGSIGAPVFTKGHSNQPDDFISVAMKRLRNKRTHALVLNERMKQPWREELANNRLFRGLFVDYRTKTSTIGMVNFGILSYWIPY